MFHLNRDRSSWLLGLFLVLGVLAPSGAVLWFMNDAARSQAASARQRVTEAYREQLRLLRDRADDGWKSRAAALDRFAPSDFAPAVKAANADSVILLDAEGRLVYPSLPAAPSADPAMERPDWVRAQSLERTRDLIHAAAAWEGLASTGKDTNIAARAAQGQIRCLVRAGRRDAALAAIQGRFLKIPKTGGRDLEGRLIAADEQLLALHLLQPDDPRFKSIARRLVETLNDYGGAHMASAQRLFLMGEMQALAPEAANFPTYPAEILAERLLEAEPARPGHRSLAATGLHDVWKLSSPNHKVIALYRSATVASLTEGVMAEGNPSRSVRITVAPPGSPGGSEAIAAGGMLPGWQISFTLLDTGPWEEAARRRMTTYIWLGCAVVAAIALAGIVAGQFLRRQAQLNRLKTDLLAAVSHELKTPLASTRLLVETLLEDQRPDAAKTTEYLKLIAGENLRLTRLVENFLTFSRIERNRQRFEFTETQPSAVVASALAVMRERLQAPGCHLEVDLSPSLPTVLADQDALTTVLLNLLDNAFKYTPTEKRIRLRAYRKNGRLAFDVEDNGIGIAPREQKRIFRRFYQVDRRLARETGGCGLGLSIVEFIVRAHGGEVGVESRPGAGSIFCVCLPCRPAANQAPA